MMGKLVRVKELEAGKHICVVTTAVIGKGNPVAAVHEKLLLIFVVERATGVIINFDINTASEVTADFIRSIFLGKNLINDIEEIKQSILQNYLGASARAIVVATRSARERLVEHLEKEAT